MKQMHAVTIVFGQVIYLSTTNRMIDEMGYVSIATSIYSEGAIIFIVVQVKEVSSSSTIIYTASPLSFFICYYL